MCIYSNLRRNIIKEGGVYNVKDIFSETIKEDTETQQIDNPEFYDIETKTLKLGNLCARDIKNNKTPKVNFGGGLYTTYCSLAHLSNILEPTLVPKLHQNIDKIYNFLRRDLKYDNRVKFHSLFKTILEYDDPANTMNIIVDFIENTSSVDDISIALDRFRKSNEVGELDIDAFLRQVKTAGHQEYEKSFYGEHFKKHTTRLTLKYRTEEENLSILRRVEDVIDGKYEVSDAISILHKNMIDNYTPEEMVKSDLECIKDVYDKNGDTIIKGGDYLEVKKLDYAADSYLSEFMAMYKNSKLPDYVHEPEFLKTYNQIVDGLFVLFNKREDIIDDIKRNFAGIVYDDRIFISKDDVELYWSNKGRSSCLKDHRLSIRYRINKSNLMGYVYDGGDVLIDRPVKINLSNVKNICPIIGDKGLKESYNLNQISTLLVEGRLEDIIKKYKAEDKDKDDIIWLSNNDPSGNNKYLGWMVKIYWGAGKDSEDFSGNKSTTKERVVSVVKGFHENIQRIENKDINTYPNYGELDIVVEKAEQKRKDAELKKEAKKQKTVIHDDDEWFVVSPHSWKASCYYGAGTKWCVTMKDTASHWDRYSRSSSFFYVVDKTKNPKDRLYKVAYRKIGTRDRFELWDAEDFEISSRTSGQEWLSDLPNDIKKKIDLYHEEKYPKGMRPAWIEDDPRAQSIINYTGNDVLENLDTDYYGLNVYITDSDDHWVSADSYEMEAALYRYYDEYSDSDLLNDFDWDGEYLHLDEDDFITDETNSYMSNINDDEALERSGLDQEKEELEEEIESFRDALGETEDDEEVEDIESQIETLTDDIDILVTRAKESVRDEYFEDFEYCFSSGGIVGCLVHDRGLFSSVSELYDSGIVELYRDSLLESISSNGEYDDLASAYGYDEAYDDDDGEWYVFEIDY